MQNPGDLRVPEGVVVTPAKKVLVLDGATLVREGEFDEIHPLYQDGGRPTAKEEREEISLTTVSHERAV